MAEQAKKIRFNRSLFHILPFASKDYAPRGVPEIQTGYRSVLESLTVPEASILRAIVWRETVYTHNLLDILDRWGYKG